ncbi:AbrB family transcriptional regulator [Marinobacterium sp. YM272]|uniref:AbrB family transcriptional regulator n=1 Tax=Marinobacterium sp. YM272 TaxID=3421654 RepID=UPI003D7F4F43
MLIILKTLAVGLAGGWLATLLHLPSPWLLGAMLAVLLAIAAGVRVQMPDASTTLISLFLGVSIASGIDAGIVDHLRDWSATLILMIAMLGMLVLMLFSFYRYRCRWSSSDALLSSVPGNLAVVMLFAAQAGLSIRRIALVHSVRLFFLVTALPLAFPITQPADEALSQAQPDYLLLLLVFGCATAGGWCARRLRIPAGMLTGALFTTLALKFLLGLELHIPQHWFNGVLAVLGTAVAVRMAGLDLPLLRATLKGALGGLSLALVTCGCFALVLHFGFDIPLLQALLAYMPGGIEVMVAIAFSTDVDPVFVATHQLVRVLVMCFALPLMFKMVQRPATECRADS